MAPPASSDPGPAGAPAPPGARDWTPPDKPVVSLVTADLAAMSKNERIKVESRGLYYVADGKGAPHSFSDEVEALRRGDRPTISGTAKELSKFFGIYQQQERGERGRKTGDHIFMVRIKCPGGGSLSAEQWAALDSAAERFGDGTLRLTSRQAIQYHHVHGPDLAPLVRHLNRAYRRGGSLAACGDVNRNVMVSPIDGLDPACDPRAQALGEEIAEELAPRTSSYFQIFVSDAEGRNAGPLQPEEPLYGEHYLPRKFKIGLAHPTDNAVDVLSQDVGLVPVDGDGRVWDLYSGGGMGLSHNNPDTAALPGLHLGRIRREQAVDAIKGIVTLQKEHGERKDRKRARWKYTLRRLGLEAVRKELVERFGVEIEGAAPVPLPPMNLHLGWREQGGGRWTYGISVENGRLGPALRKAVRAAVDALGLRVRLTPQQDLLLFDVADREALQGLLDQHGVRAPEAISLVRRNAMACPAKPTCGLAMTEAERILPRWIDALEAAGLGDVDAVIRVTGCPNNCARPPMSEIGIYGYGKNDHVVLVGGARNGSRLAHPLYERLAGEQMVPALVGLFRAIREHKPEAEPVGDFLQRVDPARLRAWIGIEGK